MNWLERSIAFGLIVLLSPIWVAIIIAALLFQGRPIFFLQERVGLKGETFYIVKFRSMRLDNAGSKVTSEGDPRITGLGRILRGSKMDEMPQLLNILKGEMGFVGPRPEVPKYVAYYSKKEKKVLDRLPGITDMASLAFRDEEKLMALAKNSEEFYIKEILPTKIKINLKHQKSWFNDFKVVIDTVMIVLGIKSAPFQIEFSELEDKARKITD